MVHITEQQLATILPHCRAPGEWATILTDVMPRYDINTPTRAAQFIAQLGHESAYLNVLEENLNYSWRALRKTFPRHFPTDAVAREYHRQPERIANRAYANRMENGPESSGDGWRFRGRGPIQITGRQNYRLCSQFLFQDNRLLDNPSLLSNRREGLMGACWFWSTNNLNSLEGDVVRATRRINGGLNGLKHRKEIFARALPVLESNWSASGC